MKSDSGGQRREVRAQWTQALSAVPLCTASGSARPEALRCAREEALGATDALARASERNSSHRRDKRVSHSFV
jgi:hypothetical protein